MRVGAVRAAGEPAQSVLGGAAGGRGEHQQFGARFVGQREVLLVQLQVPDQRVPERLRPGRAGPHVRPGPQAAEALAPGRQLADQRGQPTVLGEPAGGQPQVPDHVAGAALPVRVEAAPGFVEEQVAGGVQARHRLPEEQSGQAVPAEHVLAVVDDQRGRAADQVEDAQQLRPQLPAALRRKVERRLRGAVALPGQAVQVPAPGPVQAEHPGERVEHLLGGLGGAPLLQAHVVVDADPGQVRDLFAAQPGDPAAAVGGDADGGRVDPGTPAAQETREIVHALSMAAAKTREGGPAVTRNSRPSEAEGLNSGLGGADDRWRPIRRSSP